MSARNDDCDVNAERENLDDVRKAAETLRALEEEL